MTDKENACECVDACECRTLGSEDTWSSEEDPTTSDEEFIADSDEDYEEEEEEEEKKHSLKKVRVSLYF
jgi:hypothetical protein